MGISVCRTKAVAKQQVSQFLLLINGYAFTDRKAAAVYTHYTHRAILTTNRAAVYVISLGDADEHINVLKSSQLGNIYCTVNSVIADLQAISI